MKAQHKSFSSFMNRHVGPASAVQNNTATILAEKNPPQHNPQHALPIHAYNNHNHHLEWEDATYACAVGKYMHYSTDPNVISTRVKSRLNDFVGELVIFVGKEFTSDEN